MRQAARAQLEGIDLDETLAYIEQGEAFFMTAQVRTAAHPLLYYYAMLNVGKAVLRTRGFSSRCNDHATGSSITPRGPGIRTQPSWRSKVPTPRNRGSFASA
jgi:hypothetical protein